VPGRRGLTVGVKASTEGEQVILVEHEHGLGRADLGHALEPVEHDVAEGLDIGDADQQGEVEPARGHGEVLEARKMPQLVPGRPPGVLLDVGQDQRRNGEAYGGRVDDGGEALEDPGGAEAFEALVSGGPGDVDLGGQLVDGDAAIALEDGQELAIRRIEYTRRDHRSDTTRRRAVPAGNSSRFAPMW